jgi:putative spermidine/putrescine transport system permease protein
MWLKIVVGVILLALLLPIFIIIPISFTSSNFFQFPPPGYSLRWYQRFLEDGEWSESLLRSLNIAFFTSILSTVLGTMAAVTVTRLKFFGKKVFMSLMVAPMVVPVIIVGLALYYSFAPLKLNNSLLGIILGHTVLAIPIVFVIVTAGLKGIDRNLELAAMGLGSTPLGAFFKITVPLIRSSLLSGYLFAFITSLDEVVVTIFISGANTKTLPIVMWETLFSNMDPTMAAVSSILIVGTIALFLFQGWVAARSARLKDDGL